MASYKHEGSYKDSDTIYQGGFSIIVPKKSKAQSKKKKKTSKSSAKNTQEDVNKVKRKLTETELNILKESIADGLEERRKEIIKKTGSM